ncbi:MAG: D-alanyl-D-alanine carboxypeptidase [Dactylosporangium sp.]|nr:D-alanyl-D-alanine carboxypeptidase [Dactylosporangium sp.]
MTALASALLATPTPVLPSSSSTVPSPIARSSASATRPPFVPCPTAALPSLSARPPRPVPPTRDPARPTVGGEGLATAGLTLPPGVSPPPGNKLSATSWVVADLDSGALLGACGPHEMSPPASVQKLLLAATVLPKLDPAQVIEVTQSDLNFEPGSSAVGLLLGGHYTVETLWLGLFLNSGNDAANVLARLGGGSAGLAGGLQAMNDTARHLGALDTHAVTSSGLDGPGQFTSAYDLALIARFCFARADFRKYDSTQVASIPAQPPQDPKGFQISNDNQLMYQYPGALGGKVGFTDLARHTYVGAAERNGRRLVVTLLGAEAEPVRGWQQAASLLDWGFSLPKNAAVGRLVEPGDTDPKPAPSPSNVPVVALPPASRPQRMQSYWSPTMVGGVVTVAVVVPLALILAITTMRRRRSSQD